MTENLHIRVASPADLDDICDLSDQINRQHHAQAPDVFNAGTEREKHRLFWQASQQLPGNIFFVAEQQAAVIGLVTANIAENRVIPFLQHRKICRIGTIVVRQDRQRQGVGTRLILETLAWAAAQGAQEIKLEVFDFNRPALAFYERLGFRMQSHIMQQGL